MEYILIIISSVFVNNIVLTQFLGVCPFLGVSNRISTSLGMSGAVMFVMVVSTIVTYIIHEYVLVAFSLTYIRTITFILVIASLVQMVEIVLKKTSPPLYEALGVFLPLITTNCTILGVAVLSIGLEDSSLVKAVVFSVAQAVGFGLALVVFAGLREQLELLKIPKGMKGIPVALVTAGILAMAFMGFAGIVK
ncbi:MAG: RnfABCDGE type electron transport complex subunit A [Bacteroidales bacterium]|nr:RnfABCDGE type electron transport complex subunit A [Bacteroidales bacterium]